MPWDLSVPDWRDRIREGRSLLPALPHLDRQQADRAIAIFNKLHLPDVPGTPALAEAGGDWFREIVGALHGAVNRTTREEFLLIAPTVSLAHIAFSQALGMIDKDPDGFGISNRFRRAGHTGLLLTSVCLTLNLWLPSV